jgi:hypothetical protein
MKRLLFILSFIFITSFSFAQTNSFGIKGGFNFSTQIGDNNTVGTLRGFNIGGFYSMEFDGFAIQPGAFYSVKGVKQNLRVGQTSQFTNQVITLNYIQIPINTIYKFPTKSPFRFYLGGGPYFADAISGWSSTSGQSKTELSFDDYYRIDFGIAVMGGVEIKNKILIGFNYDMGITPVSQVQTRIDIVNRTLGLSVGYQF